MKYWLEKGKKGFSVYKYLLRRRPDQGDLATSRVEFGGKSAPKGLSALTRPGVFDVDISCGKEPGPVCPLLPCAIMCLVMVFGHDVISKAKHWDKSSLSVLTRVGIHDVSISCESSSIQSSSSL